MEDIVFIFSVFVLLAVIFYVLAPLVAPALSDVPVEQRPEEVIVESMSIDSNRDRFVTIKNKELKVDKYMYSLLKVGNQYNVLCSYNKEGKFLSFRLLQI